MVVDEASVGRGSRVVPFPPRVRAVDRDGEAFPMIRRHLVGNAPRTRAILEKLAGMAEPCVGCANCTGVCADLIDLIETPDAILSRRG